jgi:hypothetical protein
VSGETLSVRKQVDTEDGYPIMAIEICSTAFDFGITPVLTETG